MGRFRLLMIIFCLVLVVCGNVYAFAREIAIISNKDYPVDALTKSKVKDIYLGEITVIGNTKVKPIEHKDTVIKEKFIENIIGSSIDGYKAYWIKKFFQEGIAPPVIKASSTEVIETVSQTNGSIGYVWADEAAGAKGIKVLLKVEVGD